MIIRKEYDLENIVNCLKISCGEAEKEDCFNVSVPINILCDVIDVLKEQKKREENHQTLESALSFIEMENGTQSNEFELSKKRLDKIVEVMQKQPIQVSDIKENETEEIYKNRIVAILNSIGIKIDKEILWEQLIRIIRYIISTSSGLERANKQIEILLDKTHSCFGSYNMFNGVCSSCSLKDECHSYIDMRTKKHE